MNMQPLITMSVIDGELRFPQLGGVLDHDELLAELLRQIDSGKVKQADVARALKIAPARITELKRGERQIQQREMLPLAKLLRMPVHWTPRDTTVFAFLRDVLPVVSASPSPEDALQAAAHEISAAIEMLALDPSREKNPDLVQTLVDGVVLAIGGQPRHTNQSAPGKSADTGRSS